MNVTPSPHHAAAFPSGALISALTSRRPLNLKLAHIAAPDPLIRADLNFGSQHDGLARGAHSARPEGATNPGQTARHPDESRIVEAGPLNICQEPGHH